MSTCSVKDLAKFQTYDHLVSCFGVVDSGSRKTTSKFRVLPRQCLSTLCGLADADILTAAR